MSITKTTLLCVLFAVFLLSGFCAHSAEPQLAPIVRPDSPTPTEGELVSILKRNLPQTDQTVEMKDAPEWFQNMIQKIVRENIPDKYVQEKDWGKTDKRWDGLQVRRKGPLRLTTKRKWKDVNHGSWKRYEITQVEPTKNLKMRIENVHETGKGKMAFEVSLASRLHVHGRRAQWAKGVQMFNISADADASVRMRLWCEVGTRMDIAKFPPDVVIVPEVTRANLDVTDFRLQSISKMEGPVVKQLSKSVHKVLLDKIDEKRHELPKKINREIAKNEDRMRLSLSDFAASKWEAITGGSVVKDEVVTVKKKSAPALSDTPPPSPATRSDDTRTISTDLLPGRVLDLVPNHEASTAKPNDTLLLLPPGN